MNNLPMALVNHDNQNTPNMHPRPVLRFNGNLLLKMQTKKQFNSPD